MLAREGLRAALILICILNVLFFPCVWGHKTFLESSQGSSIMVDGALPGPRVPMGLPKTLDGPAAAWFFEPSLAFTSYEYTRERTIPLWNPYQAYGTPFAADMQSQPLYPLTIVLSLDLTPRTYNLYLLTRLFVAGFFTYLFLRLFVSFVPALAGGIAAMLGGYYILYMTMPHLSVEILIPAALFSAEQMLRTRAYSRFLAFTAVLFLVTTGGMPESSILLFALLYSYIVFRIFSDAQLRRAWIPLTVRVSLASLVGLCLSCVLLLPFLEFVRHCYDTHQSRNIAGYVMGLSHLIPDSTVLTYLFPLIYGPHHAPYFGLRNEFGLVAFFLILIAVLTGLRRTDGMADRRLGSLTYFFLASSLLVVLKRYGIAINNIGSLPLFRYVNFWKYDEPILSICVAALCGIGLERLIRRQASKTIRAIALSVSFVMAPLAALIGQSKVMEEVRVHAISPQFPEIALGVAASAIFCVAICLFVFEQPKRGLGVCIACILTLELSLNYIVPLYYIYNNLPNQWQNPYIGAPYVDFLKRNTSHFERIFARESLLYPDWASAFQLQDVRDLDAMYYWKYLPFVRDLITPGSQAKTQELWDRFTGWDAQYPFATPLARRLLQLSSARYIVSVKPYTDVPFKLVYDREVKIYEYDDVVPRAAVYFRAEIAQDETDTLNKLADPNLNVFQTVVINGAGLAKFRTAELAGMNQSSAKPVAAAAITSYRSQAVEIHASLEQTGILVLNDSGYPGWDVTVDGRQAKWLNANYLFRGVLLSAGSHVVRFEYRPRTFYLGCAIASCALICLLIPMLRRLQSASMLRIRKQRPVVPNPIL